MNVTVERTAPDTAVISVEVEPERVSRAVGEAYRRLAQRYAIPGFRRGKVPRPVLESFLGRDTIYREALEQLVDETFDEAVESQDLRVVGSAQLEETAELRDGEPLRYRATVKVKPPVTVPDPRQLTVDVDKPAVTEEDVEHFLQDLQRVHGKLVKAEEVGPHSLVRAEVETEVEGQLLEEKRETLLDMEQGDPLVEDLPAALAGSPAGEVRQVVWTVPQDHPLHGGKEAVTRIRSLEIRDRQLAPLDEALARKYGAQDVDELRAKVRESLERAARRRYVEQRVQRAVQLLTEAAQVTVPEPLVDRQTDILYEDFLRNLRQQGIPLEAYQAATGQDEKAIRERLRPRAEERAKQNLVLEALALQEELLPGEGEIRAAAQELLGIGEKGPRRQERTLTRGQREYLRDVLLRQHAMELLQRLFGEAEAEEGEAQDLREGEPSQVSAEAASGGSSPDRAAQDA